MKNGRYRSRQILFFILVLSFVLLVSLSFGHVLGSFYVGNIANDKYEQTETDFNKLFPADTVVTKTKVLRLNKIPFYTIQAGALPNKESALSLGYILAEKGLPAVVTENESYCVMIGFLNNAEKLSILADSISIDGQKPVVQKKDINSISFKFIKGDTYAETGVAPYLGDISTALHKGILLYSDIKIDENSLSELKPKFVLLAEELRGLDTAGKTIAEKGLGSDFKEGLLILAKRCGSWAESLSKLNENCTDLALLISQQQALALLEDYHRFMTATN